MSSNEFTLVLLPGTGLPSVGLLVNCRLLRPVPSVGTGQGKNVFARGAGLRYQFQGSLALGQYNTSKGSVEALPGV